MESINTLCLTDIAIWENGKKVLTMADFYFAVGSDPCDVFIVVNDNWIPYKRCETEDAAKALVIGQNKSRRDDNA